MARHAHAAQDDAVDVVALLHATEDWVQPSWLARTDADVAAEKALAQTARSSAERSATANSALSARMRAPSTLGKWKQLKAKRAAGRQAKLKSSKHKPQIRLPHKAACAATAQTAITPDSHRDMERSDMGGVVAADSCEADNCPADAGKAAGSDHDTEQTAQSDRDRCEHGGPHADRTGRLSCSSREGSLAVSLSGTDSGSEGEATYTQPSLQAGLGAGRRLRERDLAFDGADAWQRYLAQNQMLVRQCAVNTSRHMSLCSARVDAGSDRAAAAAVVAHRGFWLPHPDLSFSHASCSPPLAYGAGAEHAQPAC